MSAQTNANHGDTETQRYSNKECADRERRSGRRRRPAQQAAGRTETDRVDESRTNMGGSSTRSVFVRSHRFAVRRRPEALWASASLWLILVCALSPLTLFAAQQPPVPQPFPRPGA